MNNVNRGDGNGIAELCSILSRPFPSPATRAAAERFLAADASLAFDQAYDFLVWQRTLRIVLGHLEDAGADMDALGIAAARFRQTFPRGYQPVWDVDVASRVSLRRMLDIYETHRRLLASPVGSLVDGGLDQFTLLSGRAYEARYPGYSGRVEFDTDLIAPDIATAMSAATLLDRSGFALDTVRVRRLGSNADATVEIRRRTEGHLVSVGILVGGYHGFRGPIHELAEIREFQGRPMRVPIPEHLLLMLAARVERKQSFAIVNINDAAVILSEDGATIDWDLVVSEAWTSRLGTTLAAILTHTVGLVGEEAIPESVITALVRGHMSRLRWVTHISRADMRLGEAKAKDRLVRRLWLAELGRRRLQRPDTLGPWPRALIPLQRRILTRQLRSASSGAAVRTLDRLETRLRTRTGAFCELAPHLAGGPTCLSRFGPWSGSAQAQALVAACAGDVDAPRGPHRCKRMLFDLSHRHGT